MPRIALVSMPFASSRRPSLQLGLLKGLAEQAGWEAVAMHLGVEFAGLVGRARYELLCQHRGIQLAEWVFSLAAFGESAPDPDGQLLAELPAPFVEEFKRHDIVDPSAWFHRLRGTVVPAFLEACTATIGAGDFAAVGFTSTFQQNAASFALAARLKREPRPPFTIFGGANFDDVMGVEFVRSIAAVDVAVIGEGDAAFPELLHALADGREPRLVPGVAVRNETGGVDYRPRGGPFEELDSLPFPDYADYFERAERLGFFAGDPRRTVDLPFEGARGCWWGQKHHCVFCGLNAGTMKFRSKSPARVLAEMSHLSSSYRSFHLEAVDNIIDMKFLTTLIPEVERLGVSWNIFFEAKSNLTRDQIAQLGRAGVRRIQPGIESLSSPVLKIMRKGVKAIQNVNLLRWCAHDGISVSWNMLWGFPGETAEQYDEQTRLIPLIRHLQPPDGQGRLWLERFSPLFSQQQAFGVRAINPIASYRRVYPASVDLDAAAYFFDYEMDNSLPEETFGPLVEVLDAWRGAHRGDAERPMLRCLSAPGFLRIEDGRDLGRNGVFEIDGLLAAVYGAAMIRPTSLAHIAEQLDVAPDAVEGVANDFVGHGLMMREDDLLLALALPSRGTT
jgi:ribosomal peptide maturation radical SAM protein 1